MFTIGLSLLIFLIPHSTEGQYIERDLCSSKCLCLPTEGVVACHETDNMRAIPTNIDKTITRFIIQKGSFDSPTLYRHNLTGLEHLTFLKIIYYNLHFIASQAFIKMERLQYLDLSHNKLINIEPFAFGGLSLLELHIMENVNINFQRNAFSDMTALTINMRSNNLSDLNYDLFKDTKVKYFYLYNNRITTIDPNFQNLFNDSSSLLDLSNNPLICDCSLSWLAEVLATRFLHKKSVISSKKINISCNKPLRLLNKELMFLKPEDLKCSPLRIEAVKLHFDADVTQLTCVSRVGGYKPPTLTWLYYVNEYDRNVIEGVNVVKQREGTLFKSVSIAYNTINLTKNYFKSGLSKLICLVSADDDLVQRLEIHIHNIRQSVVTYVPNNTDRTSELVKETNFLFIKHFSILEMLGAVLGTFSATFVGLLILLRYLKLYQDNLMNKTDFIDMHKNTNSIKPYWYIPHGNSSTYSMPNSHQDYEIPASLDNIPDVSTMHPSYMLNRSEFLDYKTHNPIGK